MVRLGRVMAGGPPFPVSVFSEINIGSVMRDDNTTGVNGAVQTLSWFLKWVFGVGARSFPVLGKGRGFGPVLDVGFAF